MARLSVAKGWLGFQLQKARLSRLGFQQLKSRLSAKVFHSLPGSGSGKQNIRHSQKIYIFWKLFTYRIIIAIHNGASWVLPISDFFKLLYSKKGKFSLFFFISKLIEK